MPRADILRPRRLALPAKRPVVQGLFCSPDQLPPKPAREKLAVLIELVRHVCFS